MVRVTDNAHQKRRHGVVINYAVEALPADFCLTSLDISRTAMEGRFSYKYCFHSQFFTFGPFPFEIL
jgi:hypothetical protein